MLCFKQTINQLKMNVKRITGKLLTDKCFKRAINHQKRIWNELGKGNKNWAANLAIFFFYFTEKPSTSRYVERTINHKKNVKEFDWENKKKLGSLPNNFFFVFTEKRLTDKCRINYQSHWEYLIKFVFFKQARSFIPFLLGGPGSGKVTHCDNLMQEKNGITHINMTDLLQQYALGNGK